jgi:hypothetical protein
MPCHARLALSVALQVTTDHDPRGSRTLDAPLQLEGLYPFYFDEVRKD